MEFVKIVTKNGEVLWLRTDRPVYGWHEIAQHRFAVWEARQSSDIRLPKPI